jgi:hypothetical protein
MSNQFPSVWMTSLLTLNFREKQSPALLLKPSLREQSSKAKNFKRKAMPSNAEGGSGWLNLVIIAVS